MTVQEIKSLLMFETNNDEDDLSDYLPYAGTYISEGYDRLVYAFAGVHVAPGGDFPPLDKDSDVPLVPEWTHKALCDWAAWCIYRNGNIQKQNRGMAYRNHFEEVLRMLREQGNGATATKAGEGGGTRNFFNIPD